MGRDLLAGLGPVVLIIIVRRVAEDDALAIDMIAEAAGNQLGFFLLAGGLQTDVKIMFIGPTTRPNTKDMPNVARGLCSSPTRGLYPSAGSLPDKLFGDLVDDVLRKPLAQDDRLIVCQAV